MYSTFYLWVATIDTCVDQVSVSSPIAIDILMDTMPLHCVASEISAAMLGEMRGPTVNLCSYYLYS